MNIAAWSNCTKRSAEAGSSKIVTQSRDSSLKPGDTVGGGRGGSLGFNGHASNDGGIQRIVCGEYLPPAAPPRYGKWYRSVRRQPSRASNIVLRGFLVLHLRATPGSNPAFRNKPAERS